jgi:hypothetical protein
MVPPINGQKEAACGCLPALGVNVKSMPVLVR